MYKVEVDLSDLRRIHTTAHRQIARHARTMFLPVARAAQTAGATDSYKNRTRNLRTSTVAQILQDTPTLRVVLLGMLTEYASFVNKRGFSNIDALAKRAEENITRAFERNGKELEGS